jgi:cysteine-rich repeat protein
MICIPLYACVSRTPDPLEGGTRSSAGALGASNDHTVLVLSTTVDGAPSREEVFAVAAGYTVEKVDAAGWAQKSTADFATYRAIILGDANCALLDAVSAALANQGTWGPAVDGNVIVVGTDPVYHEAQGGNAVTQGAVQYAAAEPGKTGAYIALSCYYHNVEPYTKVPLLAPFESPATGVFALRGVGCYNDAHRVADHPALTGTTDASMSGWGCSVHEAFVQFPDDFLPLAIARNVGGPGVQTFGDGSSGVPYILARGDHLVPVACGDGHVTGGEECDDGNTNNCDGCSAQCRSEICGNGKTECAEGCDDGNTTSGDGCSSTCEEEPAVACSPDTTPPHMTCPTTDISVKCGEVVEAFVGAGDDCGMGSVTCDHPLDTPFPEGTTHETCWATDAAGNTSSCKFDVVVVGNIMHCTSGARAPSAE